MSSISSVEAISVTDTLRGAGGVDSLVTRGGVRYLPNDVLLTWFNEGYRPQYLSDYKRPERTKVTISFAAPSDTFPVLTIADGPLKGVDLAERSVLRRSATRDTLVYWITDSMVYRQDSLLVAARYLRTDTLDNLTWTTDTLKFNFRQAKKKEKKKKKDDADTVPKIEFLAFTPGSSVQDVHRPMMFSASQPLSCIDSSAVHLEIRVDTVWRPLKSSVLEVDSLDPMLYRCDFKWEPGAKYRIRIDSAAITSVYGRWNRPVEHEFTVKKMEDYANLFFRINDLDTAKAVVELYRHSDQRAGCIRIVNVASEDTRPLRDFVEEIHRLCKNRGHLEYGTFVQAREGALSICPTVDVLRELTDGTWIEQVSFARGIGKLLDEG